MKALRLLVPMLALTIAPVVSAQEQALDNLTLGQPIPATDVEMKALDGHAVTIGEVAGKKGTLVVFMCAHCPWVKAWQGRIASLGNAATRRGIGVIAINSNDPTEFPDDDLDHMKAQAAQLDLKFPYVMDHTSNVGRAFGATHTPEIYLFDAKGKLVYHGAVDDNARNESQVKQQWLRKAVDAVAAGKTVPVGETKAFGCGIKLREKVDG